MITKTNRTRYLARVGLWMFRIVALGVMLAWLPSAYVLAQTSGMIPASREHSPSVLPGEGSMTHAQYSISSTFDANSDGWIVEGYAGGPVYVSSGGNPGGFI
ncbi:MAG TPA: hypothetical protein VMH23_19065, partial [Bacteroidota bacterium]|nr:hypothetical protein [Bacteroidota bacterium]